MPSADLYRQQAGLLLSWAAAADAVVKEQLRRRAQEYLALAAPLEQQQPAASSDQPDAGEAGARPLRRAEPGKSD